MLDQSLTQTHRIGELVQRLDDFLGRLSLNSDLVKIDDVYREVLDSLHNLDNSGQVFRYCTVKVGTSEVRAGAPRPR